MRSTHAAKKADVGLPAFRSEETRWRLGHERLGGGILPLSYDQSTGGGRLTLLRCLQTSDGHNGRAFTSWVSLPGDYSPDVLHPFRPGTPPPRLHLTKWDRFEMNSFF
ncbi:hypothetical protein CEXT_340841 [Caerostris extrusa]|uniref:Uncharacterized protein n=1 Tax=Caerostris extrusa TaxID=172846 RepID=A0AAV4NB96_CAEEX|nr:hypothetical protein CEXT_340841 [Caerostris extrusa]